ncbi:hypothetical protein [Sphingomonas sp.]|uniref:hypothetical protein n=1 Tax=Sphingomonas sp. TaxID=28214 RepID=UPI002DD6B7F3|nr:hypothetical protein [Sphingomonas sp.]
MRAIYLVSVLLLAGCAADPSTDMAQNGVEPAAEQAGAKRQDAAPSGRVGLEEVEFAYRCRGLLSAASASERILPAGEAPAELARIDMRAIAWWTGEASRRGAAAGIDRDQRAKILGETTRVLPSREKLGEALPAIRECLALIPA